MKTNRGFTIVELMITLAVAAILLAAAAPSFRNMIMNNRLATQINDFVGSMQLARSEAIKRGQNITICISTDGASCAGGGTWDQGWIVFVDTNANGAVDGADEIINAERALSGDTTLTGNANVVAAIRFNGRGFAPASNGTLVICDTRGSNYAKGVIIANSGRVRRTIDSNGDQLEEDSAGNPLACP